VLSHVIKRSVFWSRQIIFIYFLIIHRKIEKFREFFSKFEDFSNHYCQNFAFFRVDYLEDVCRRIMGHSAKKLHELLPDEWL